MIRIAQLKLPIEHGEEEIERKVRQLLHLNTKQSCVLHIRKRSLDARKKPELFFSYTVDVELGREDAYLKAHHGHLPKGCSQVREVPYHFPISGTVPMKNRPVIVGCGPAGLFCAFMLAKQGYHPILLERGLDVDKRTADVEEFWNTGRLNPQSNVQFGEGGAGTFSDGKLNTLVKDASGRNREVMRIFVEHGAPEEITFLNHPHIGTDVLRQVVKSMRKDIIAMGAEVRFGTKMEQLQIEDGQIVGVTLESGQTIPTNHVVLAVGHSARDTFQNLLQNGVKMTPKAFAVGVRIQHPQEMINESQYGRKQVPAIGAADYKVTYQAENGRGVYSFCMCPGGYVVNSSSEENRLVVNGMSNHARDTENANTALIVTVKPEDFGSDAPLSGMEFQRKLEEAAYRLGNGKIPIQLWGDFQSNVPSTQLGKVIPVMKGEWNFANLRALFPDFICESLLEAIPAFGRMIVGYDRSDSVLAGVESRTSSPIRMEREAQTYQAVGIKGLYPCGEGAGYAGGITSAAMDGIRVAEAIAAVYAP